MDRHMKASLDRYLTSDQPESSEEVLGCLLAETYDREGRLMHQHTLPLFLYPPLTERKGADYTLDSIRFQYQDGSEMIVTRHEP